MTTNYSLEMVAYFLATITMIVNTKYLHYIIYLIEKNFSDVLIGKSRTFSFYINAREPTSLSHFGRLFKTICCEKRQIFNKKSPIVTYL